MTWRESGRERSWWVNSSGKLVVHWRPILSEWEEPEDDPDPLDLLTDKQRFVVELRYGLRDGYRYSLREVASLMGISFGMVSQHEKAAIKKLEKHLQKPPTTRQVK